LTFELNESSADSEHLCAFRHCFSAKSTLSSIASSWHCTKSSNMKHSASNLLLMHVLRTGACKQSCSAEGITKSVFNIDCSNLQTTGHATTSGVRGCLGVSLHACSVIRIKAGTLGAAPSFAVLRNSSMALYKLAHVRIKAEQAVWDKVSRKRCWQTANWFAPLAMATLQHAAHISVATYCSAPSGPACFNDLRSAHKNHTYSCLLAESLHRALIVIISLQGCHIQ